MPRGRRTVIGVVAAAVLAATVVPAATASAQSYEGLTPGPSYAYEWINRSPEHFPGGDMADSASMSGDGNVVAFGYSGRFYARDRTDGSIERLDVDDAGAGGDSYGFYAAAVDGDGSRVAFATSYGDHLDPSGHAASASHIYLRDRSAGTTRRLTVTADGTPANGASYHPTISSDGRYVAFWSSATDLVPGGAAGYYLHEVDTGTTQLIAADTQPFYARLSADGSVVAYGVTVSYEWWSGAFTRQVRIWDRETRESIDASVGPDGEAVTSKDDREGIALSGDGTVVAFVGRPPGDPVAALYVRDLSSGVTERVSRIASDPYGGTPPNWTILDLSDDGRYVGFTTTVNDFAAEGSTPTSDTFIYDRSADAAWAVTPNVNDDRARSIGADLSSDANVVAFRSEARLDPDDVSGWQAYVADATADTAPPTWPDAATLTASEVGTTMLRLDWTPADDAGAAPSAYRLFQDGVLAQELDGQTTGTQVTGLTAGTTYDFAVEAADIRGNWSVDGPTATVTTASAAQPGEARLAATARAGGMVDLVWDPSPMAGLTGYAIHRAAGDGSFQRVADVGEATTTFTDSELAAATSYHYRVAAIDANGGLRPHTGDATVTTPALSLADIAWLAPRTPDERALLLGADLSIIARGEPSRTVVARVEYASWFDHGGALLEVPTIRIDELALTEDPTTPGRYTGTFPLAEGTAEVRGIRVAMTDGAGHEASADARLLPLPVSGAVSVAVDAPEDWFRGGRIVASSTTTTNGAQAPLTGRGPVSLAPFVAGDSVDVRVLDASGRVLAEEHGLPVRNGLTTERGITPIQPASLTVRGVDDAGRALAFAPVTFSDAAGDLLERATTDGNGYAQATARFTAGETVHVEISPRAGWWGGERFAWLRGAPVTVTLVPWENDVPVVVQQAKRGTLTGTVEDADGRLVPYAVVNLSQRVDGHDWSFSTTSGEDGTYALTAYAGDAVLTVGERNGPPTTLQVVVPADATEEHHLTLARRVDYTIDLRLFTRYADESIWREQPIDHRVAYHFDLKVLWPGGTIRPNGSRVVVPGAPLDEVQVCADGAKATLPSTCRPLQLGADRHLDVDLHLGHVADARLELAGADGRAWTADWVASLKAVEPDGRRAPVSRVTGTGSEVRVAVPAAGTYEVWVGAGGQVPMRAFDIVDGQRLDLGRVMLVPDGRFGDGSHVRSMRPEIAPGDVAEFRTEFRNGGTGISGAVAHISLPPGATLLEPVTLDGAAVDATATGDTYAVLLGDVASGGTGVLRHRFRAGDTDPGATLTSTVTVTYDGGDGPELLGADTVTVAGVTLVVASAITSRQVSLSGRAPAGDTVAVRDSRAFLGQTVASPGGLWSLNVQLPDLGPIADYELWAESDGAHGSLRSPTQSSRLDVRYPTLTEMSVSQADGRHVTFDPREGVARFPYVVVTDQPIRVGATFTGPGHVEELRLSLGAAEGTGAMEPSGEHVASLSPAMDEYGPIGMLAETVPGPREGHPAATIGQLRERLPGPVRTATATSASATYDADGFPTAAEATIDVGGSPMHVSATWERGVPYTPTTEDLQKRARTGIPVYGLSYSPELIEDTSGPGAEIRIRVEYYVPEDVLGAGGASLAAASVSPVTMARVGGTAPGAEMHLASAAEKSVRAGFEVAWKLADGASSGAMILNGSAMWKRFIDLEPAIDKVVACDPIIGEQLRLRVKSEALSVLFADVMKSADVFVGGTLNPGAAAAKAIVTQVIGLFVDDIDAVMGTILKDVEGQVRQALANCRAKWETCKDLRAAARPGSFCDIKADLSWIFDPSGYVFEAVESNRVEGATATLLERGTGPSPGTAGVWDAEWYGQENPLVTDADGRYGWDVPEGWWQVAYSKAGYELAFSDDLEVLPPHFDVNVGIVSLAAPEVSSVTAVGGAATGVEVTFDRYMEPSTEDRITVIDAAGLPVAGTVEAVGAEESPQGVTLARTFRFVPVQAWTGGETLTITVDDMATSYADRPMLADVSRQFTAARPDDDGPTDPPGQFPTDPSGPRPPVADERGSPACPHGEVPSGGFRDTPGTAHEARIDCAAWWRLAKGFRADEYGPTHAVTRAQMASFLQRMVTATGRSLPPGTDRFTDDDGSVHEPAIDALAAAGIVRGVSPGRFGPHATVSRAQMASFLVRTYEYVAAQPLPASTVDHFDDDDGTAHEQAINQAAAAAFTSGVGPRRFAPRGEVSRGQMATFLTRVLDTLVEEDAAAPPGRTQTTPARAPTAHGRSLES